MDPNLRILIKKVIVISVFIIGVIVAFILFKQITKPPVYELFQSEVFGSNFLYSKLSDNNKMLFFTGTSVAEIDISNPSVSKSLTSEFGFNNIEDVIWDDGAAYVNTGPLNEYSPLLVNLSDSAKDYLTNNESWWRINISEDTAKQVIVDGDISKTIGDICIGDSGLYASVKNNSSSLKSKIHKMKESSGRVNLETEYSSSTEHIIPSIIHCSSDQIAIKNSEGKLLTLDKNLVSEKVIGEDVVDAQSYGNKMAIVTQNSDGKEPSAEEEGDNDHSHISDLTISYMDIGGDKINKIKDIKDSKYFFTKDKIIILNQSEAKISLEIYSLSTNSFESNVNVTVGKQSLDNTRYIFEGNKDLYASIENNGDLSVMVSNVEDLSKYKPIPFKMFSESFIRLSQGNASYELATNSLDISVGGPQDDLSRIINTSYDELSKLTSDINQVRKYWIYTGEFYD